MASVLKPALTGVTGDSALVPVDATDKFLTLRLEDDKFFLTAVGGGSVFPNFAGDGGITTESSMLP